MEIHQPTSTEGLVSDVTATSPITSSGGDTPNISTSMSTNKLIGRGTAGTGVMEEITIGTGLSLSGTTLNSSAVFAIMIPAGSVDGSNQIFVFASAPSVVIRDGISLQQTSSDGTVNWTGTTTITLSIAPNFDIFGY